MTDERTTEEQALEADQLVSIKGEIIDISKRFWAEGWGFGRVRDENSRKEVKITGLLEGFRVGQVVSIVGKFHTGKYGQELRVETIVADNPNDTRGIRQWLIDRIPQIGPKRAAEVAGRFGPGIWEILETNPNALLEVSGITPGRVDEIVRSWEAHKKEREKYVPFYDLGLTHREAKAADKAEISVEEVTTNPFVLYLRVPRMSFARNEVIAERANASLRSPTRLISAAVQAVRDAAMDGHTAVDGYHVIENAAALASVHWNDATNGLRLALEQGFLCESPDGGMIMLPGLYEAETGIAAKIASLLNQNEAAHGGDHSGPGPGGGGADDAHREGGYRDGTPWDGEEYDPA